MRSLVLASSSPRRLQLLQEAGFCVEVDVSGIEEIENPSMDSASLAIANARLKWNAIASRRASDWVLAADTVVWLDGVFYSKPVDFDDARRMLSSLAGRTHEVVTGVVFGRLDHYEEFAERSLVTFRNLDSKSIENYLSTINPLDKAGGYAAQDDGGRIIARIDGSMSNVVGLPMEWVIEAAGRFQRLQ